MYQRYVDPAEYDVPWLYLDTAFREHLLCVVQIDLRTDHLLDAGKYPPEVPRANVGGQGRTTRPRS
jgi:hypothetical protein